MQNEWAKNNKKDKIWWEIFPHRRTTPPFSFDKKVVYTIWADYPHKLTPEQKEIFDKENPFWADFFKDRPYNPEKKG